MIHDHQDCTGGAHFDAGIIMAGRLTRLHKGGKNGELWRIVTDMAKAQALERKGGGKSGGAAKPAKRPELLVTRAPGAASAQASAMSHAPPELKRREYRGTLFTGGDYRPTFGNERSRMS